MLHSVVRRPTVHAPKPREVSGTVLCGTDAMVTPSCPSVKCAGHTETRRRGPKLFGSNRQRNQGASVLPQPPSHCGTRGFLPTVLTGVSPHPGGHVSRSCVTRVFPSGAPLFPSPSLQLGRSLCRSRVPYAPLQPPTPPRKCFVFSLILLVRRPSFRPYKRV